MWSLYFLNCVNHISNWCEEQHRAFLSSLRSTIGSEPEKVFMYIIDAGGLLVDLGERLQCLAGWGVEGDNQSM